MIGRLDKILFRVLEYNDFNGKHFNLGRFLTLLRSGVSSPLALCDSPLRHPIIQRQIKTNCTMTLEYCKISQNKCKISQNFNANKSKIFVSKFRIV